MAKSPAQSSEILVPASFPELPQDALAQVPDAGALQAPTEAEIEQTELAAAAVLAALKVEATAPATRRALKTALRYWALWHRAVYGTELELLQSPAAAVPGHKVLVFVTHHAPVKAKAVGSRPARITTGMPVHVRKRLAAIEAKEGLVLAGRRQVQHRAGRQAQLTGKAVAIDADVPALKTIQQRVSLLGSLHTLRGLPTPQEVDGRIRPLLSALGKAVQRTTPAALPQSKKAIEAWDLQRMLATCGSHTLEGKRDQALLLATYSSGRRRSEVARMQLQHLRPGQMDLPDGQVILGYWWDLYEMKGKVSEKLGEPVHSVPLVGAAAEAMDAWLDALRLAGHKDGPVWRTVYKPRRLKSHANRPLPSQVLGAAIRPELVATIVKQRALQAYLIDHPEFGADEPEAAAARQAFMERIGAHSLRSGFSTSSIKAGVSAFDVMKMTGHTSISSFRIYDQSGNAKNPAIAELMQFQL
ncbi:tyrosine-type recombinase/integrase [Pseudoxanthomonas sp. LjRoot168]|uniref:hypothetical protein n=1 Tax=unclassified Pseudoxanthomonas TaxID=2645906 RepID=UPI003ECCD873